MPSDSLRSSSASTLVIRAARCGLRPSPASASRPPPVSSPLKATPTTCSARLPSPPSVLPAACCRPPITTAPVNMSVMSRTVQHLDHCADSLRTGQVLARLVASGDIASLVPSDSLRSSSALPLHVPRRAVQARPSPASALPLALVSGPLLAPPSVCSTRPPSLPPALSATQSPWRLPSAGFPGAVSPSLVPQVSSFRPPARVLVLTPDAACCRCARARACRAFPCALGDTGRRAHAGTSVFSRAYTPSSHPCRPRAAHVAQRSRDVFSSVAECITTCYIV